MYSDFDSLRSEYLCIECDFWLSSIKALFYKGLMGFYDGIVVIFGVVKSGEMLDFSGFARSGYRSDFCNFTRKI